MSNKLKFKSRPENLLPSSPPLLSREGGYRGQREVSHDFSLNK